MAIAGLFALALVLSAVAGDAPASADPVAFSCTNSGFLTQASTVTEIDLVTGDTLPGPSLPVTVNGAGYNLLDGMIYVWDYSNTGIGRFDATGAYEPLGLPAGMADRNWNMGDVDGDGYLWLAASGGTTYWTQIDVRPGSPTFAEVVASGSTPRPASVRGPGADWAWVPGRPGKLYATASVTGALNRAALIEFDMATSTWTVLGELGTFVPSGNWSSGATYADADGYLYAQDNATGIIIRIDVDAVTAAPFSVGPPSSVNDGASCADRSLDVDFGDAPPSYSTTLADDGPRHSLQGFAGDRADLMLGTTVTSEADPAGTDTDADDAFAANPVIVRNTAQAIDVSVTNDSTEPAVLVGWLDVDGSGTFDPGEATTPVPVPAASGTTTVSLDLPALPSASSWLRLRLLPASEPISATGAAAAGEVEDWTITTTPNAQDCVDDPTLEGCPVDGIPLVDPRVGLGLLLAAGAIASWRIRLGS